MLEKFRQAKQAEIRLLQKMEEQGMMPQPWPGLRPSLMAALHSKGPGAVIAEYKRASPSRGLINAHWTAEDAAAGYAQAGAAALSVLTEEIFFQGSLDYLESMAGPGLPLLRKDFLLHPLQVQRSAATQASAVLLIARMLTAEELEAMLKLCSNLGLEAVVEVFGDWDLEMAKAAGAKLIQVNNRNLDTLTTDVRVSLELIDQKAEGEVWISASGLDTAQDMRWMRRAGFDGLLMGTRLMREANPGLALAKLLEEMG